MRISRRFAAPAVALMVALGASGCASFQLNPGCNLGLGNDPMADGASLMNRSSSLRGHIRAQHQAYQRKALMGSQNQRGSYRKPGEAPVASSQPSQICYR